MNRKLDLPNLLVFTALMFGIILRFYPGITNGLPLNDGGMFYTMVQDLKANDFRLPEFTTYNHSQIPFVYPPLGFYITALLSTLIPGSDLSIFTYLPAFITSLCIPAFYLFAKEILPSRLTAALATLLYTFCGTSFVWVVMGGGVTRSLGILFLLLMMQQSIQMFRNYQHRHLLLAILFGVGAVTSHPQTALHAALGGLLIFLFFGLNKRGVISAIFMGLGVALLSAPWWGTVISQHGLNTLLSAGHSRPRELESYLTLFSADTLKDLNFLPVLLLAIIGTPIAVKQKDFFSIAWVISTVLIDPLAGGGMTLFLTVTLAARGFVQVAEWISRLKDEQVEAVFMRRGSLNLIFGLMVWLVITAFISNFQLVNSSLKAEDLKVFAWVRENVKGTKTFLLATGRDFSLSDPWQEWFPALAGQRSVTTLQGLEWTYGENFFPWYSELTAFQHCHDAACVDEWALRNHVEYDYLIVLNPDTTDDNTPLKQLGNSVKNSAVFTMIYESDHAYIFELKK